MLRLTELSLCAGQTEEGDLVLAIVVDIGEMPLPSECVANRATTALSADEAHAHSFVASDAVA